MSWEDSIALSDSSISELSSELIFPLDEDEDLCFHFLKHCFSFLPAERNLILKLPYLLQLFKK